MNSLLFAFLILLNVLCAAMNWSCMFNGTLHWYNAIVFALNSATVGWIGGIWFSMAVQRRL